MPLYSAGANPSEVATTPYWAAGRLVTKNCPVSFERTLRWNPVFSFFTTMDAPGITAPLLSATTPVRRA